MNYDQPLFFMEPKLITADHIIRMVNNVINFKKI
jgi:hypothetical protein